MAQLSATQVADQLLLPDLTGSVAAAEEFCDRAIKMLLIKKKELFNFPFSLEGKDGLRFYNGHKVAESFGFEGTSNINHAILRIEARHKTTLGKLYEGTPAAQTYKDKKNDPKAVYVAMAGGSSSRAGEALLPGSESLASCDSQRLGPGDEKGEEAVWREMTSQKGNNWGFAQQSESLPPPLLLLLLLLLPQGSSASPAKASRLRRGCSSSR